MSLFLTATELVELTGRRTKSKQIAWLRTQGIPFRINAIGHPVVTRSAIEGRPAEKPVPEVSGRWEPRVVGV